MIALLAFVAAEATDPMRYYPERAQKMGIEGSATINCQVTPQNTLDDCKVISETPPDAGFGEAALRMAPLFKMRPKDPRTPSSGGRITIPIQFRLPGH